MDQQNNNYSIAENSSLYQKNNCENVILGIKK